MKQTLEVNAAFQASTVSFFSEHFEKKLRKNKYLDHEKSNFANWFNIFFESLLKVRIMLLFLLFSVHYE